MRTGTMALVFGALLAEVRGGLAQWPMWTLLMLWPTVGGHLVEIWFLNWLRPRLVEGRAMQVAARVAVWFVAGAGLALGMYLTATMFADRRPIYWLSWWLGGLAFIAVELVAHLFLQLRGRPSFYNGRG